LAHFRTEVRRPRPDALDPRSWNDPVTGLDDVVKHAFFSAEPIAAGVRATQGVPIRLIPVPTVRDIGLCVGAIETAELMSLILELDDAAARSRRTARRAEWDSGPVEWSAEDRRRAMDRQLEQALSFQRFFVAAAEAGEMVMVVYD
jgi:hypothetical protein